MAKTDGVPLFVEELNLGTGDFRRFARGEATAWPISSWRDSSLAIYSPEPGSLEPRAPRMGAVLPLDCEQIASQLVVEASAFTEHLQSGQLHRS